MSPIASRWGSVPGFISKPGKVFLVNNVFHRGFEKQLNPMGPIASRWGSVPGFISKPIATCDVLGVRTPWPPLDPPMNLSQYYKGFHLLHGKCTASSGPCLLADLKSSKELI